MKKKYCYKISLKVRDYECDIQGIVNNANYQHYLEHARHEFLLSVGYSFNELHLQGIDAMVARVEIDYKKFLKSGDEFEVYLNLVQDGFRLIFEQDIYRTSDQGLCLKSKVFTVCVVNGHLARQIPEMDRLVEIAQNLPIIEK